MELALNRVFVVFVLLNTALVASENVNITFPPWADESLVCSTFCDSTLRGGCSEMPYCKVVNSTLQLTPLPNNTFLGVRYMTREPVRMWDAASALVASFQSFFVVKVSPDPDRLVADGFSFLIAPDNIAPARSFGSGLGLYKDYTYTLLVPSNTRIVAVTFDTFRTYDDKGPPAPYVGLDVNSKRNLNYSVLEKGVVPVDFVDNRFGVWIDYDAEEQLLEGRILFLEPSVSPLEASGRKKDAVSVYTYRVNLASVVNELSYVGFSAGTGFGAEVHEIFYWTFETSLVYGSPVSAPVSGDSAINCRHSGSLSGTSKVAIAVSVSLVVLAVICGTLILAWRLGGSTEETGGTSISRTWSLTKFILGSGPRTSVVFEGVPRPFSYHELKTATKGFSQDRLLGEGAFGTVYKGLLSDDCTVVAIKRVAENSAQGEKEFLAEVSIIGRLCHRNLVALRGWCQDWQRNELLLVYDYMPNGSLDQYMVPPLNTSTVSRKVLSWADRYHIIEGVAAALLYLHEDCQVNTCTDSDQRVLHRDVKPSNILLDSEWNARLGDFGLARLVERNKPAQTASAVAGTPGYLPPEYPYTRKVGVQSDVYSFGVVALEVAAGRQPVEWDRPRNERFLVEWMWTLHKAGRLLDAVDPRLESSFNDEEMLLILRLGLLCTLKEPLTRPSMRQVTKFLAVGESRAVLLPEFNCAAVPHYEAGFSENQSSTTVSISSGGSKSSGVY